MCYQLQVVRCRQGHLTFVGEERLVKAMLRLFIQVIFYKQKYIYFLYFIALIYPLLNKIYCFSYSYQTSCYLHESLFVLK